MRDVEAWLDEYGESHRNTFNKAMHWICVPLIAFSVIALLWSVPMPAALRELSPLLNLGTLSLVAAVLYYVFLSTRLALGMMVVSVVFVAALQWLEGGAMPPWQIGAAIFVLAWIGQFIGHAVEGKRPSFFKDLQFLLIGPIWLLAALYRSLHLRY